MIERHDVCFAKLSQGGNICVNLVEIKVLAPDVIPQSARLLTQILQPLKSFVYQAAPVAFKFLFGQ